MEGNKDNKCFRVYPKVLIHKIVQFGKQDSYNPKIDQELIVMRKGNVKTNSSICHIGKKTSDKGHSNQLCLQDLKRSKLP